MDTDSPVDTAADSLEDVSPKISDERAALKTMALALLAYVVIRLDVAAKAGASCCTRCTGPKHVDVGMGS